MALSINRNLALELPQGEPRTPVADPRALLAAQFISAGARVLDLSPEPAALAGLLPQGATQICAPAAFPAQEAGRADIIVMLGALERTDDVETLFAHLRAAQRDVVLSYVPTNLTSKGRRARGFVNDLSYYDLAVLFDRYGLRIACTAPVGEGEIVIRLTGHERLMPVAQPRIAIITGEAPHGFGERLGLSLVQSLLPGEAEIDHLTPDTLAQARSAYDLVVLGTGNGLFQPLMSDDVLDVLMRGKARIGLFGTAYRALLPRVAVERVIERLDTWYARHEDDVLGFGRGRANVVHAGDVLIDRFPLARASDNDPLEIGPDIGSELPLDGTIALIQRHRQVYSTEPDALLCALTSADMAAYADWPGRVQPGMVSGQFRSLLIDIFGRTYPEKQFFLVDRDAVARYKGRVHRTIAGIRETIAAALRNVAVA